MADDDARLEEFETKLAFQEDTIQKLNDVVVDQESRIHHLETSLRLVLENLREQTADEGIPEAEEQPPHY